MPAHGIIPHARCHLFPWLHPIANLRKEISVKQMPARHLARFPFADPGAQRLQFLDVLPRGVFSKHTTALVDQGAVCQYFGGDLWMEAVDDSDGSVSLFHWFRAPFDVFKESNPISQLAHVITRAPHGADLEGGGVQVVGGASNRLYKFSAMFPRASDHGLCRSSLNMRLSMKAHWT